MLAFAAAVRWNVQSFMANGPMTRKKFLIPDFDACSVALFASLVFMGPLAARTQPMPVRPALVSTRVPAGTQSRGDAIDTRDEDTSGGPDDAHPPRHARTR
jgi:hypothetical protein